MTEPSGATISVAWLVTGLISVLFVIVGFLLTRSIHALEKKINKIDDITLAMHTISHNLTAMLKEWESAKAKVDEIPFMNKRVDAAWKRLDEHDKVITALRERTHDIANFVNGLQLCTKEFKLKPINKGD